MNENRFEEILEEEESDESEEVENLGKENSVKSKKKKISARFDCLFFKRFLNICCFKLSIFSFTQILLFIILIVLSIIQPITIYMENVIFSKLYQQISVLNWGNVWTLILYYFLLILFDVFCEGMIELLICMFNYFWRKNLTRDLLEVYFEGKNYYLITNQFGNIDNPDQRIHADCMNFSENLAIVFVRGIKFFISIVSNIIFVIKARAYFMFIPVIVWPIMNIFFLSIIFSPVAKQIFRKDTLEGDFRFRHHNVREFGESMAFFKSQKTEHDGINKIFNKLVRASVNLAFRFFFLNFYTQLSLTGSESSCFIFTMIMVLGNISPFTKEMDESELTYNELYIYNTSQVALVSVSSFFSLSKNCSIVIGNTARIGELYESIRKIRKMKKEGRTEELDHSQLIEMKNVDVQTPQTKINLVKNLNFRVKKGKSLIIIGPSGCGKSSILRVLAGLWDHNPEGIIRRPRIDTRDIFFLPQKPYLVKGSLRDNIVYPLSYGDVVYNEDDHNLGSICSDKQLEYVLTLANATSLLRRASLHEENINWDVKLSQGEQQRVALARLFFHRPKFAILDECTSALDEESERICYQNVLNLGIIPISVAHRITVLNYHDYTLKVMGKNGKYEVSRTKMKKGVLLDNKEEWRLLDQKVVDVEERDMTEESLVDDFETSDRSMGSSGFNLKLIKRIFRLMCGTDRVIFFCDYVFLLFLFFVCFVNAILMIPISILPGSILGYSVTRNVSMTFLMLGIIIVAYFMVSTITALSSFLFQLLGIRWRRSITRSIQEKYFSQNRFYKLNVLRKDLVDCPDQRICMDVNELTSGFSTDNSPGFSYFLGQMILALFTLLVVLVESFIKVGFFIPLCATGGFFITAVVQVFLMIMVSRRRYLQQKKEGFFRTALTRIKEYSEQIGFFQASERERDLIMEKLSRVLYNQFILSFFQGATVAWNAIFMKFCYAFTFVVIGIYWEKIIAKSVGEMSGSERMTLVQQSLDMYQYSIAAFLGLFTVAGVLGNTIGNLSRVSGLFESFKLLDKGEEDEKKEREKEIHDIDNYTYAHNFDIQNIKEEEEKDILEEQHDLGDENNNNKIITGSIFDNRIRSTTDKIQCENLTVSTPTKRKLFYQLNFSISIGENLLVSGPSGCGKSSLIRTLGGLWRSFSHNGRVFVPTHVGENGIFFLPQKPYLPVSTLKKVIIYPHTESKFENMENNKILTKILKEVNLKYILKRNIEDGDWEKDVHEDIIWSTILSPGEQQRISMARLLYHKPCFAILDESTSALDPPNEALMYMLCEKHGITVLSIGHRSSIIKYHSKKLIFDGNGGWSFYDRKSKF